MSRGRILAISISVLAIAGSAAIADEADDLIKVVIESAGTDAERAAKLVEAAADLGDNPKIQKAFCLKAYEFGIKHPDGHESALTALDMLGRLKAMPESKLQDKRLSIRRMMYTQSTGKERMEAAEALLDSIVAIADRKAGSARATEAISLYQEAARLATYLKRKAMLTELRDKTKDAMARTGLERKIKALRAKIAKDPKDAASRRALIIIHVVELDDPAAAKALLTNDVELDLQTCVQSAASDPAQLEPADNMELAKWYAGLAGTASRSGKENVLVRARDCYKRAANSGKLRSVDALKAKLALKQVEKELEAMGYSAPGSIATGKWIDLMTYFREEWGLTQGTVTVKGNSIALEDKPHWSRGRTSFGIAPTGSYKVGVVFTGKAETYAGSIHLPAGRTHGVQFGVNDREAGFGPIKGVRPGSSENVTTRQFPRHVPPNTPLAIEVEVILKGKAVTLNGSINGRKIISYNGVLEDLSRTHGLPLVGLGQLRSSPVVFSRPRINILTGEGVVHSPEEDAKYAEENIPVVPAGRRLSVSAITPWTLMGRMPAGAAFKVRLSYGHWYYGTRKMDRCEAQGTPDGKYYLQGRIGKGKTFRLVNRMTLGSSKAGPLYMGMSHDTDFDDNDGSVALFLTPADKKRIVRSPEPRPVWHGDTTRIPGNVPWTRIGTVKAGQYYQIRARETWRGGWQLPGREKPVGPEGLEDKHYMHIRLAGGAPVRVPHRKRESLYPFIFYASSDGLLEAGISHPSPGIGGTCDFNIEHWDMVKQCLAARHRAISSYRRYLRKRAQR